LQPLPKRPLQNVVIGPSSWLFTLIYRSIGLQRSLSLEILASSKQGPGPFLNDYGLQIRWEQPVDHNRLIGEVIVGRFWPQLEDASVRSSAWALGAGPKMNF
jgi:hypothetical protein